MPTLPVVTLAKDLRPAIGRGHPWIYQRGLRTPLPHGLVPGDIVQVVYRGAPVAIGMVEPGAAIAVRILARSFDGDGKGDDDGDAGTGTDTNANAADVGSAEWTAARAKQAGRLRMVHPALAGQDAMRLIHGENDLMPGLIVDVYNGLAVVAFDGAAARRFWHPRIAEVLAGLDAAGCHISAAWERPGRDRKGSGQAKGQVIRGRLPDGPVYINEAGARFEVDVRAGQKTGFFLDQRDNRLRVRELAADAEVLNLFCYTGGFSVHAALGGARRVVSVDSAAPAMACARRNFVLNQLPVDDHEFLAQDAFAVLDAFRAEGRRFDVVIVDPPSFAPSARAKPGALRAYHRLNRMAMAVTKPGGWLVAASCSSHISRDDWAGILARAAEQASVRVQLITMAGAAGDHPTLPGFPEGNYLKAAFAIVEHLA